MAAQTLNQTPSSPKGSIERAQIELRRREAAWRRQRAEVARLIAAGEEEAAARLRDQIGDPPEGLVEHPAAPTPTFRSPRTSPNQAPKRVRGSVKRAANTPRIRRRVPRRPTRRIATWKSWIKSRPPWMLSGGAHLLLLGLLAMATFVSFAEPPLFLNVALDEGEWSEEIAEVSLATPQAQIDAELPIETDALERIELSPTLEPAPLEMSLELLPLDSVPVGLASLMTQVEASEAQGAASEGQGEGNEASVSGVAASSESGPPGKVRFFGAESQANRVVFVVDNSGSMQYGRMETTLVELERAVKRLSHSQSFYVVFFSDQAYPMFFPEPVHEMLPATRENKQRLSNWLPSVEMCLGGRLLDAVELAASLEPEVIYLLSDGDIRSQRVMSTLTDPEAWDFPIHTLAMGARDKNDAGKMAAIAEANDGGYKFVRAQPKSLLRARRKPIPYNRTPGSVWGTQVQSWGR